MGNTISFKEWLTTQYEYQTYSYRMALGLELHYTLRIYGTPFPDDVKVMLRKALAEIKPPTMDKYLGDRSGTMIIFNTTPKPDFDRILGEVLETI